MHLKVKSKIWIDGVEDTFLSNGRVTLLKRIETHGSISSAAKSMGMSYKKAWHLIDSMNKQYHKPLVVRKNGGKGGGGTELTEEAFQLIEQFDRLALACREFVNEQTRALEW